MNSSKRKICRECGDYFETRNENRECCSRLCGNIYGRRKSLIRSGNPRKAKKLHLNTPQETAYIKCRNGAKRRHIKFSLTIAELMQEWQKPCFYCGEDIKTIGIDRIDSSIGYIAGNIRSCCKWCNWMKNVRTSSEFIDHCHRIVEHLTSTCKTDSPAGDTDTPDSVGERITPRPVESVESLNTDRIGGERGFYSA
jgi:hypothetical protein